MSISTRHVVSPRYSCTFYALYVPPRLSVYIVRRMDRDRWSEKMDGQTGRNEWRKIVSYSSKLKEKLGGKVRKRSLSSSASGRRSSLDGGHMWCDWLPMFQCYIDGRTRGREDARHEMRQKVISCHCTWDRLERFKCDRWDWKVVSKWNKAVLFVFHVGRHFPLSSTDSLFSRPPSWIELEKDESELRD